MGVSTYYYDIDTYLAGPLAPDSASRGVETDLGPISLSACLPCKMLS